MIEDNDLLQFLQSEEQRSVDTTLNVERTTALEMYRGDPFGDEIDGRSKLRTRDVAEVVDYMATSILRTLVSGDKIAEFEPGDIDNADPETMKALAKQATERIHWNFLREQDGYSILHDGIKAGLLEKSGIWKSWVERPLQDQTVVMNAAELDAAEGNIANAVEMPGDYDVDELTGEPLALYEVTLRVPGKPKFRDAAIANDEFFVAADARTLDTAAYLGNTSRQCLYELMEMGYAEEDVENLWDDQAPAQQLRNARDADRSEREDSIVRTNLNRVVTLREEYCRWYWEGRHQLVRVHRVNTDILSVEAAPFQPYTLWCPFPMQHRLIGQSLADKTMDIQVVRSHMLRQAMDALYIANAPRIYIDMSQCDDVTIDDALDVAPGGLIRGRGPNAVQPLVQPFAAGNAFEAMEIMAGEKESRTGITRLNQGLDADALNKTATGTALMQASGQQIEEYIARNAANAIGEMFEKKAKLMMAEMQPHQFPIDGKPEQINPAEWPKDMRLGVRVGLGSGSKDKKLQGLQMIMEAQANAYQLNPQLVTPQQVFSTFEQLVTNLGLGQTTQFCADPATFQPQPEPPNPETMKVQADAQLQAQKQQGEQQMAAIRLKGEQDIASFKISAQQQDAAQKQQLARDQAAFEAGLARDKANFEAALAQERMDREFTLEVEQMNRQHDLATKKAANDAELQKNRAGGDLSK